MRNPIRMNPSKVRLREATDWAVDPSESRMDGVHEMKAIAIIVATILSVKCSQNIDRVLNSIPKTSFTCLGKGNGYFADIEARCQ
ncbi:hypothetical protein QYM36_011549, partial [Artemia franciscana]